MGITRSCFCWPGWCFSKSPTQLRPPFCFRPICPKHQAPVAAPQLEFAAVCFMYYYCATHKSDFVGGEIDCGIGSASEFIEPSSPWLVRLCLAHCLFLRAYVPPSKTAEVALLLCSPTRERRNLLLLCFLGYFFKPWLLYSVWWVSSASNVILVHLRARYADGATFAKGYDASHPPVVRPPL